MKNSAMNDPISIHLDLFLFLLNEFPEVKLLHHMVHLCLTF